ncbi:MAG: hypothetical protein JWP59_1333 [Massilia sp.]|nr:hypothetical protein [Massilia sp.]
MTDCEKFLLGILPRSMSQAAARSNNHSHIVMFSAEKQHVPGNYLPAARDFRFFGASMVPWHSGVPHRQAKACFTLGVWRSS